MSNMSAIVGSADSDTHLAGESPESWSFVIRNTFVETVQSKKETESRARAGSAPPLKGKAIDELEAAPARRRERRAPTCSELAVVAAPALDIESCPTVIVSKAGAAPTAETAVERAEIVVDQGERRTTVVVRGLPHALTRAQLLLVLDEEGFYAKYDFVYLPIDFNKGTNFGYAFVDFVDASWALRSMSHFEDFADWGVPHKGHSNVVWSVLQNLENHIERYRNSPVLHESVADECKPIMLDNGARVPFPAPTAPIPTVRRLRTQRGSVKQLRWDTNKDGQPYLNDVGYSQDRRSQRSGGRWACGAQGPPGALGLPWAKPLCEQAPRSPAASPKSQASWSSDSTSFYSDEGSASSSGSSTPPRSGLCGRAPVVAPPVAPLVFGSPQPVHDYGAKGTLLLSSALQPGASMQRPVFSTNPTMSHMPLPR